MTTAVNIYGNNCMTDEHLCNKPPVFHLVQIHVHNKITRKLIQCINIQYPPKGLTITTI